MSRPPTPAPSCPDQRAAHVISDGPAWAPVGFEGTKLVACFYVHWDHGLLTSLTPPMCNKHFFGVPQCKKYDLERGDGRDDQHSPQRRKLTWRLSEILLSSKKAHFVGRQAVRQDASRRSTADDDVLVAFFCRRHANHRHRACCWHSTDRYQRFLVDKLD